MAKQVTFYKFIKGSKGFEYQAAQGYYWTSKGYDIFACRDAAGWWEATEGKTGLRLYSSTKTMAELKKHVTWLIEEKQQDIQEKIKAHIDRYGISPLYAKEEKTMTYFDNCETLQELKTTYRRLAMKHHPDRGGDTETMKRINAEYEKAFTRLQAADTAEAKSSRRMHEVAREYMDIIAKIINLDGLEIELVGAWLWIGGDTRKHKDALKAAGCYWAPKRALWYWRPAGYKSTHSKRDISWIKAKYGAVKITADGQEEAYQVAKIA